MNKETKKLYTPFVLRTGFMHSYRRTLPLLGLTMLLEFIFWTLGDFWPRLSELGYERWGMILVLTLIIPIGVWVIKDIVADYDDLFDAFDEETEESLKSYRRMSRPPSGTQEEIRCLFKNQETYNSFRDGVREIILEKWIELGVFLSIGIVYIVVFYFSIYPKILGVAHSTHPLLVLEVTSDVLSTLLMTLSISLLVVYGIGYLRSISHLGASRNDFGVWNYIQHLRGDPEKEGSFMSYWEFYDCTSMIGRRFSRIAFRIVLLMVVAGVTQVLFGPPGLPILIIAGWSVFVGIMLLALPLNSLHNVMTEAKKAVIKELDDEYDHLTLRFVSQLREQRHGIEDGRYGEGEVDLATNVVALRGIIQEANQHRVWPIEFPLVLRILLTSLIPLFITFIDVILTLFGIIT
ncbi:MAG: hypothetical protein ACXABV_13640 [Candidatus Thorarchaeota archaeon]